MSYNYTSVLHSNRHFGNTADDRVNFAEFSWLYFGLLLSGLNSEVLSSLDKSSEAKIHQFLNNLKLKFCDHHNSTWDVRLLCKASELCSRTTLATIASETKRLHKVSLFRHFSFVLTFLCSLYRLRRELSPQLWFHLRHFVLFPSRRLCLSASQLIFCPLPVAPPHLYLHPTSPAATVLQCACDSEARLRCRGSSPQ